MYNPPRLYLTNIITFISKAQLPPPPRPPLTPWYIPQFSPRTRKLTCSSRPVHHLLPVGVLDSDQCGLKRVHLARAYHLGVLLKQLRSGLDIKRGRALLGVKLLCRGVEGGKFLGGGTVFEERLGYGSNTRQERLDSLNVRVG